MKILRAALCGLMPIAAKRPETTFFGRVPLSHAAAYAALPQCRVVAVCDFRPDLISAFRHDWADTWAAPAGYRHVEEMLAEARPDLLSICTPDDRHAEIIALAAELGVGGILCEAPLAVSLASADLALEAVARHGAQLSVVHRGRFDPLRHRVRDAIALGDIGELRQLRCHHAGPRATLFRSGSHAIDTLCFLADLPALEVGGRLEDGFDDWDAYRGDGGHLAAHEPTASARIRFAGDVMGHYDGVRSRQRSLWYDIVGTDGVIRLFSRHAELSGDRNRTIVAPPFDAVGLSAAAAELAHAVGAGGPLVSDGHAARQTLAILLGICASHQRGGRDVALDSLE